MNAVELAHSLACHFRRQAEETWREAQRLSNIAVDAKTAARHADEDISEFLTFVENLSSHDKAALPPGFSLRFGLLLGRGEDPLLHELEVSTMLNEFPLPDDGEE